MLLSQRRTNQKQSFSCIFEDDWIIQSFEENWQYGLVLIRVWLTKPLWGAFRIIIGYDSQQTENLSVINEVDGLLIETIDNPLYVIKMSSVPYDLLGTGLKMR